ncbi:MAG: tetratricopeptide repeat protein, partial [Flavobacteriales bacterium]|nr:tetratricopeptide repeat protein [Flavobacteriales bacterium]
MKKTAIVILNLTIIGLMFQVAFAQQPNDLIEKGNAQYDEQKFGEAEMTYREGLEAGADPFISGFNLGDALFKQERYEEAAATFQSLPNLTDDKDDKAAAYHNLGNSFLKAQKFQESVDAYKQSLRSNPRDLETKYNLSYAKRLLQQQQEQEQQQQDQNKDNKENEEKKDEQEQNQDQQEQDEKKEEEQNKDQQQQDQKQDEQKEQKQQPQPEENKISKEDAERMLDALNQDEKEIRDRLEKQKVKKGVKGTI